MQKCPNLTWVIINDYNLGKMCLISENSSETDSVTYNYADENEYSIIKHSGKVALQRVPRSTCVSVQSSPY